MVKLEMVHCCSTSVYLHDKTTHKTWTVIYQSSRTNNPWNIVPFQLVQMGHSKSFRPYFTDFLPMAWWHGIDFEPTIIKDPSVSNAAPVHEVLGESLVLVQSSPFFLLTKSCYSFNRFRKSWLLTSTLGLSGISCTHDPLVNVHITMENHHFWSVNQLNYQL